MMRTNINAINKNFRIIAIFTLVMGMAAIAQAHDKADTLSLETIIQTALENSPETARIMAETADMNAEAFEIETPDNPDIQADVTAFKDNTTRGVDIELEQPLRLSHFGARGSYANALRRTATLEKKARMLELIHSITRSYAGYWSLQEQEHILKSNAAYAEKKQKLIEEAAAQGRVDVSEALIFKAEALRLKQKLKTVRAERLQAGSALLRMAGMTQQNFLAQRPKSPEISSLAAITKMAETETNIRSILESRQVLANRRYAVAKQDAGFPEFAPRAVLSRDFDDNATALSLGLRINLPVWQRNNSEMIRANAEKLLASRTLKAMDAHNFANIMAAVYEHFKATQMSASAYRNSILPEWKKVQMLTEKKFEAGQASVLELWQVRESITNVQEESIGTVLQAVNARIELETLMGQTLSSEKEITP